MSSETQNGKNNLMASRSTIIKTALVLVLISFLVGVVLDVIGLEPLEFWRGLIYRVRDLFEAIFSIGWGTISKILGYVFFGAIIVVPVWLVVMLINMRKKK